MTTTEFIELIKAFKVGRKKIFVHNWNQGIQKPTDLIISESELDKIEKVNVELLEALKNVMDYIKIFDGYLLANRNKQADGKSLFAQVEQAIKNANNIKQI